MRLNCFIKKEGIIKDVVLLLPNVKDFERFKSNLPHYDHIDLICIYGEALNINTYKRVNLTRAQGLVMLIDEKAQEGNKKTASFISKHFNLNRLMLVIETTDSEISDRIYGYILKRTPHYQTVNHNKILTKVLNRASVDYRYFHLYATLFSFDQYAFFIAPNKTQTQFQTLSLQCSKAVIIGYIRQEKLHINPPQNTTLTPQDQLIYIAKTKQDLQLDSEISIQQNEVPNLKTPCPVEDKKVCLVGCHNDINPQMIDEFLNIPITHIPIENRQQLFSKAFWQQIQSKNYDSIILNLEDNLEFELTLYLRALFNTQDSEVFLSKIVNIINDPVQAELLTDKRLPNNFILSEKVVAQYLAIALFHRELSSLFDELTSIQGNELYVVDTQDYHAILQYNFIAFKQALIANGMLYLGCYHNGEFKFNSQTYAQSDSLVVMFNGDAL